MATNGTSTRQNASAWPLRRPEKEEEKLEQQRKARAERNRQWTAGVQHEGYGQGQRHNRNRGAVPTGPRAMRHGGIPNDYTNGDRFDRDNHSAQRSNQRGSNEGNGFYPNTGQNRPAPEHVVDPAVRARYMGPEPNQSTFSASKKRKRTGGQKFNFGWNDERGHQPGLEPRKVEKEYRRRARMLEDRDPEHGKERARQLLEQMERQKERSKSKRTRNNWKFKELADMRERDWRIFKEEFGIASKGGHIPDPMRNWGESGLPLHLLQIIDQVGYTEPTPIQRAAIPIALQARDLIGVAATGSGKTAAFLLPMLEYISQLPTLTEITKDDGPYALIMAPTRELVQQIESEARKFATPLGLTVVSLVGGHALEEQAFALRNGAEIIVATPGRLLDCIERRLLVFSQCCYVVMDEADRMIDMGFEEPVNKILSALPVTNEKPDTEDAEDASVMRRHLSAKDRYRQTMMYTATMPPAVEKIAKQYLRRPATVTIGNIGEAVETVEQRVEFVSGEDRRKKRLREILLNGGFAPPIIVFVNVKRNCDSVAREVQNMGFSAASLHGSKTQQQREEALASIRSGAKQVLVATDLAGRGLDVPDVSLVVNFNMASSIEAYTHRIGRTGRAGKSGVAITFLASEDNDVMYDLKQMLSKSSISRVPEELRRHEAAQQKPAHRGRHNDDDKLLCRSRPGSSYAIGHCLVGLGLDGRAVAVSCVVIAVVVAVVVVVVVGGGGGGTTVVVVISGSAVMVVVGLGSTTETTFVVMDGVAVVTTTVSVTVGSEWTTVWVLVSTRVVAGGAWSPFPSPSPPSMGTTEYVALGASCGAGGESAAPRGHWKKGRAEEV
ncbi:DEAD-like helicase [Apiospora phragmitis]|uniref:RNA helicase n=1 Tax=Apiospora phragmitis TaxID=2905665 RepID=A0ABR1TSA0_9PEZI